MAKLRRLLKRASDSERNAFNPMLVPIHPCHRFAPDLAEAVKPVGANRGVESELVLYGVHAEGMVGAREHDPSDAVSASAFVDFKEAPQIVFADLRKGSLHARPGHMDQHVDA